MAWYKTSKIKKMPNGKYRVTDETGKKNLGESDSKSGAEKRLRQVEYFKHKNASNEVLSFKNALKKNQFDLFSYCMKMLDSPQDTAHIAMVKNRAKRIVASFLTSKSDFIEIEPENESIIKEAVNFFEQVTLNKEQDSIDIDKYDLFIFDFDKTLSTEESTPACNMEEPYHTEDARTLVDSKGQIIQLREGVLETLVKLVNKDKKLFLISKSEKIGVPIEAQPLIAILKEFNIFDLFNEGFAISRELPKSIFVPQTISDDRIIFIDDDIKNLKEMEKNQDIDVVDATKIDFN